MIYKCPLGAFGGTFGPLWAPSGTFWYALGGLWGDIEGLWEPLGAFLDVFGRFFAPSRGDFGQKSVQSVNSLNPTIS